MRLTMRDGMYECPVCSEDNWCDDFFLSFLCNSMGSKKVDYSKEGGFVAILIRVIPLSRMRSMTLMT